MGEARLRNEQTVFLCRVAGVAVHQDRVLLHRSEHDDFWALPGGRIQVGETSAQALQREMREEVGAEVKVGRLLWVVENFFQHYPLDQPPDTSDTIEHHEIGLYLAMEPPPHLVDATSFEGTELDTPTNSCSSSAGSDKPSSMSSMSDPPGSANSSPSLSPPASQSS